MKVVFIGSGNVATQLGLALQKKGVTISQVYSRTTANALQLAQQLNTTFTSDISEIYPDADIYIYAIKDSSLNRLLSEMEIPDAIHIHTAGSVSMMAFERYTHKYGVFYPLQTFSKNKPVDFSEIPICIEASNSIVQETLLDMAHLLTDKTYIIDSEQRKKLHLAAVFACNFTNYMYDVASQLVTNAGIGFDIMQPLIKETADKIQTLNPYDAQTGPSVRYDETIIKKHLELLKGNREFKNIYKDLSKGIHKRHKKK